MSSFKHKTYSATKWTLASSFVAVSLQFLQIIILSRFLDKSEFGLIAIAMFVINISLIFVDFGLSSIIIYKQNINKNQLSTLYWLNVIIGVFIFLLIFFTAPFISKFYNEAKLCNVLRWVGVTFLIIPFAQQFEILLQKDLLLKPIGICSMISRTLGFGLSILLAIRGNGVYALVFGNLLTALSYAVLIILSKVKDYKPSFFFSVSCLKNQGFFSFGGYQMGAKIVFATITQVDTLFIGKVLGMNSLGIYNIAKTIALKPSELLGLVVSKISFPVFAKMQNNLISLRSAYLKLLQFLSLTSALIYVCFIVLARPMIIVFFGENWIEAVHSLQFLSVAAFSVALWNTTGQLLISLGKAKEDFMGNLGLLFLIPLSVIIGKDWGIFGISLMLALSRFVFLLFSWKIFINRVLPGCSFYEFTKSFLNPAIRGLIIGLLGYLILKGMAIQNNFALLFVGCFILTVLYLLINYVFDKKAFKFIFDLVSSR